MKRITIFLFSLTIVAMPFLLQAQQSIKLAASVSQGQVVQLKVIDTVNVVNNGQLNIFRKEPGGDWKKINTTPVARLPLVKGQDYSSKDKSFKRYVNFMWRTPGTGSQEKNLKGFTGVFLLQDNLFAQYAGCYFEDKTAMPGVTYEYKLTDAAKSDKDVSKPVTVMVAANTGKPVTGLSFVQQQQNIFLNWQSDDRYYAYRVYRRTAPDAKAVLISGGPVAAPKIKGIEQPYKFIDTSLAPGTTWYYQVAALDMLNNESGMSELIKVTVKDATLPKAVMKFRNDRVKKTFQFTWEPVKDKNCAGYNIYRSSESEPAYKKLNAQLLPVTATTYTDAPAADRTAYQYYIESVGKNGNTAQSQVSLAVLPDMTAPAKPQHLKGVSRPALAILSWDKGTESDLKGYWIYRGSNRKKETMVLLNDQPVTSNSFMDSLPLVSANEYVYCIQAVDKGYNKSPLSDTVIIRVPDVTAPHIVQGLDAEARPNAITIKWRPSPDADIAGYTIYRSDDSAGKQFRPLNARLMREPQFTDAGNPSLLRYYVTATDKSGNVSAPSRVIAIAGVADTSGWLPAQDLSVFRNATDSSVTITWRTLAKVHKGFMVFRKGSDEQNYTPVSPLLPEMRFIDKTTEGGQRYSYYIRTYFGTAVFKESVAAQ
jgi:fibronectin type 3 domain-containing protein